MSKRITLPTPEFIRRFLLHVLPGGLKRIRHYGVLAKGCKKTQLAQARQALQQPAQNPQATESARDFMARVARIKVNACPCCQAPLKVVQTLPGLKHGPAPGQVQSPTTARGRHGEARSYGPPSEHSLQAVWGELAPKLGATERKACSPSTASQKLRMPSPLLVANLESAGRDAGDNEQHQGADVSNPLYPPRRCLPPTPHGSVQSGLSAAISGCAVSGLGGAADKRYSLNLLYESVSLYHRCETS